MLEIYYTETNLRKLKKLSSRSEARAFAHSLIKGGNCDEFAIHEGKTSSTANSINLIYWWGEGSYWHNTSKKVPALLTKKFK